MPLHDYVHCGVILEDVYRPVTEGAMASPPLCPTCGEPMSWVPAIGAMDAFEPGQEFVQYDGQNRRVVVESFAQMRKLEQESERQYRNGEGQPIRFRHLHQNRSNKDVNSFGPPPDAQLDPAAKKKWGLQGATKKIDGSQGEPQYSYGPGVHDGNTSALDHLKPAS